MARRKTKRRASRKQGGVAEPLKWTLFGMFAGLILAVALWWQLGKPAAPPAVATDTAAANVEAEPAEPARAKPVDIEATGKDFDFYDMLPAQEIVIHDSAEQTGSSQRARPAPPKVDKPGTYKIQAGAFSRYEDADSRKAELALQGIQATIETATVRERVVYRVIIGPLTDPARVNDYQRRLTAARIDMITTEVRQ